MEPTTQGREDSFRADPGHASGFDEARLIEKLRAIEALFAGATTSGERAAAEAAEERIRQRLATSAKGDQPEEFRFSMNDFWSRKVFLALLRRYGVTPYRYRRQRHTTVMARVTQRFVDETLWPEFQKLSATLRAYLLQVTDRVVAQVLHTDSSDADVVAEQPALLQAADMKRAEGRAEESPSEQSPSTPRAARNRRKRDRRRKRRRR